jgi:Kef-type K+ transport system membrane component KefB
MPHIQPFLLNTPTASDAAEPSMVLAAVLLSLVIIYLASKIGGELCSRINLPPVLGELVGGVVVGVSALSLLVFPEGGTIASQSLLMQFLQATGGLSPEAAPAVFATQSEVSFYSLRLV